MVSYKELGLVNTKEMFKKAMLGKYAIPAYNFNNWPNIWYHQYQPPEQIRNGNTRSPQ